MATTPRSLPIERLVDALQDCLDEVAEKGAQKAIAGITPRLDAMGRRMDARLDR